MLAENCQLTILVGGKMNKLKDKREIWKEALVQGTAWYGSK
jgi:hypothetical protein